ncbi:MAG: putative selenium-dependent hydroxylase accessory protein YqeC [Natrialbaceae archaeon]|jgi:probable selenium-dependent hydroxylase accessory protein YqeC
MELAGALDLDEPELIAFVGAGGKKTAMARLVEEGRSDRRIGYTSTTHMPPPALELTVAGPERIESTIEARHAADGPLAFASEYVENPARVDEKVAGFDQDVVDDLYAAEYFDWLLVKADGARLREFKAPDVDEPPVPARSTVVVPVASAQVIGQVLSENVVHRPERVATIAPVAIGDLITPDVVGRVLASENGGCKNVPTDARVLPMINKADDEAAKEQARMVLEEAFDRTDRFDRGLVTSFETGTLSAVSA